MNQTPLFMPDSSSAKPLMKPACDDSKNPLSSMAVPSEAKPDMEQAMTKVNEPIMRVWREESEDRQLV